MELVLAAWVGGSLGYLGIAMVAYRIQYIKTIRRYRQWKRDHYGEKVTWHNEYSEIERKVKEVSWTHWLSFVSTGNRWDFHPGWMWLWPLTLMTVFSANFLHPEIEGSDLTKISKLEKELKELD